MKRALLAVVVLASLFVAGERAPAAALTPQQACDAALIGSRVLDGLEPVDTPLVCEARPAGAPPAAGGEYGLGVIHLWPVGIDPALIRKLLGHEIGHAYSFRRPDLTVQWYALRGSSGTSGQEDFAESFYLANYREPGLSWVTYGGLPVVTEQQLAVMRGWWSGVSVQAVVSPCSSPCPARVPVAPAPAVTVLPLAPLEVPTVEPLPLAPKLERSAVVVAAPTIPARASTLRTLAMLDAVREAER